MAEGPCRARRARRGLAAALLLAAAPAHPAWQDRVRDRVADALRSFPGALSLYVQDLASGTELALDADAPTHLSSAIKVVVMLEALRQVDEGARRLDDAIVFTEDDVRDGVGPIRRGPPGRSFTLRELLVLMMDRSDNAAADLLMRWLGLDAVNRLPARRGVSFPPIDTLIGERRRVYAKLDPRGALLTPRQILSLGETPTTEERARLFSRLVGREPAFTRDDLLGAFQAYYRDQVNSASMRQVGALLAQTARCDGLSPSSCRLAETLLRDCTTGTHRIRAGLPADVDWGHKTGTQEQRACDVGILRPAPGRAIVVAACTRDFGTVPEAERLMRRIGAAVWEALGAPARAGGRLTAPQ